MGQHQPWRSAAAWAVVLIYALIVFGLLPFHEPWHDEAHSWLIGRDSSLTSLLSEQAAYEGTPPLRHLLIMALAKAGLPYISLGVLNAAAAIATVAVLAFLSPFALWQKIAAAFSLYQVFMYGAVWRLYSLAGLLLLLTAWLFHARFRKPLLYAACVSLLANTCLQTLGVGLLLLLEFVFTGARAGGRDRAGRRAAGADSAGSPERAGREGSASRSRQIAAGIVMAVSIALAIGVVRQPEDVNLKGAFPIFYKPAIMELVSAPFVFGLYDEPFNKEPTWRLSVAACGLVAFLLTCWDLRASARALSLVLLTVLGWGYLFTFKNAPNVYHTGLMFYVVLAAFWMADDRTLAPPRPGRGWAVLRWPIGRAACFAMLGLTVIGTVQTIALEIQEPFSGAKDAADYLSRVKEQPVVAEYTLGTAESLLPYLPGRVLWRVEEEEFRTFGVAREYSKILDANVLIGILRRDVPQPRPWLLLSCELPTPHLYGYDFVYRSPRLAWGLRKEAFWIYCPTGAEHPPVEIGSFDDAMLFNGRPFLPFDAKALLRFPG